MKKISASLTILFIALATLTMTVSAILCGAETPDGNSGIVRATDILLDQTI